MSLLISKTKELIYENVNGRMNKKALHAILQSESCYYNGEFVKTKSGSG